MRTNAANTNNDFRLYHYPTWAVKTTCTYITTKVIQVVKTVFATALYPFSSWESNNGRIHNLPQLLAKRVSSKTSEINRQALLKAGKAAVDIRQKNMQVLLKEIKEGVKLTPSIDDPKVIALNDYQKKKSVLLEELKKHRSKAPAIDEDINISLLFGEDEVSSEADNNATDHHPISEEGGQETVIIPPSPSISQSQAHEKTDIVLPNANRQLNFESVSADPTSKSAPQTPPPVHKITKTEHTSPYTPNEKKMMEDTKVSNPTSARPIFLQGIVNPTVIKHFNHKAAQKAITAQQLPSDPETPILQKVIKKLNFF